VGDWQVADFARLTADGWPPGVDPTKTVLLEKNTLAQQLSSFEGAGSARLVSYRNTEVVVAVDAPAGGIAADSLAPAQVGALMFPIAQRQFRSTLGMRRVQPKLKALQERFKDDKPRQQQEILKLYQAEKINPAAGCLPILLQIPVFYALYKVLLVSVEMRHQPFILWIKDLSAPDPLTPVNLFGLLHFSPPAFLAIGILPILVGATQWLSMKLNPQPMDPAQAQIFAIMPWFLVFIMAPFAAGLQLYWMTNNLLTIAQQWHLYRKYGLHLSDTHPVHT